jgi:hypothetical protein
MLLFARRLVMLGTARQYAKRHASTVHSGVDKVAGFAKQRVGDEHHGKVERSASVLKRVVTGSDRPEPTGHG